MQGLPESDFILDKEAGAVNNPKERVARTVLSVALIVRDTLEQRDVERDRVTEAVARTVLTVPVIVKLVLRVRDPESIPLSLKESVDVTVGANVMKPAVIVGATVNTEGETLSVFRSVIKVRDTDRVRDTDTL
jgi:hypothetical protein